MALLFAALLSIPLGVLSASRKGGLADRSIYLFGIICMSLPNYWIGFMLLLAFAVYIPIFSIMGADSLKDFILPALALAIPMAAGNIRVFRSSLLDGYNSDLSCMPGARGVSEWKIANLVSRVCAAAADHHAGAELRLYDCGQRHGGKRVLHPGAGVHAGHCIGSQRHHYQSMRVYCSPPSFSSWSILSRTA